MYFRPSQARFNIRRILFKQQAGVTVYNSGVDFSLRLATIVDPSIGGFPHAPEMDFTLKEYRKGHYAQSVEGGTYYDVLINRIVNPNFSPQFVADNAQFTSGAPGTPHTGFFGDGSDGSYTLDGVQGSVAGLFTLSGGSYTLQREAYFLNLTINNGITLFTQGNRLWVKNTLTLNGTISFPGVNGSNGQDGVGNNLGLGGAGASSNVSTGLLLGGHAGVGGGNGNNANVGGNGNSGFTNSNSIGTAGAGGGTGGTGGHTNFGLNGEGGGTPGAGGVSTPLTAPNGAPCRNIFTLSTFRALTPVNTVLQIFGNSGAGSGSGGGAGGGGVGSAAGGGGGGGGSASGGGQIVVICSTLTGSGLIIAMGGVGGKGGNGGQGSFVVSTYGGGGGGGGGAAGGSGGTIVLIYHDNSAFVGALSANGGLGGMGGNGGPPAGSTATSGTAGTSGNTGTNGPVILYQL